MILFNTEAQDSYYNNPDYLDKQVDFDKCNLFDRGLLAVMMKQHRNDIARRNKWREKNKNSKSILFLSVIITFLTFFHPISILLLIMSIVVYRFTKKKADSLDDWTSTLALTIYKHYLYCKLGFEDHSAPQIQGVN